MRQLFPIATVVLLAQTAVPCLGSSRLINTHLFHIFQHSIILVHGLTGGRERTWTAKNAAAPWPQSLLPSKVPNARVLTFGYDAYVVDWRGVVSTNRIGNHATNLLTSIATYRENDDTVSINSPDCFGNETKCSRTAAPSYSSATVWEASYVRM